MICCGTSRCSCNAMPQYSSLQVVLQNMCFLDLSMSWANRSTPVLQVRLHVITIVDAKVQLSKERCDLSTLSYLRTDASLPSAQILNANISTSCRCIALKTALVSHWATVSRCKCKIGKSPLCRICNLQERFWDQSFGIVVLWHGICILCIAHLDRSVCR